MLETRDNINTIQNALRLSNDLRTVETRGICLQDKRNLKKSPFLVSSICSNKYRVKTLKREGGGGGKRWNDKSLCGDIGGKGGVIGARGDVLVDLGSDGDI